MKMNTRRNHLLILSISLLCLHSSCQNNFEPLSVLTQETKPKPVGSFSFSMASVPQEVKKVILYLERAGYSTITDSVDIVNPLPDTVRMVVGDVPTGLWSIRLDAKDANSIVRYRGSASVTVEENRTAQFQITMRPSNSGTGTIEILVVWGSESESWRFFPNPILAPTPNGDDSSASQLRITSVIKVGNEYKAWYHSETPGGNNLNIGFATSPDGKNWTKRGIAISKKDTIFWLRRGPTFPEVIYENGIYKMWFTAGWTSTLCDGIAYATSLDGLNWTLHPALVVQPTTQLVRIMCPSVVKKGTEYFMYITGDESLSWSSNSTTIMLSKSTDGINWSSPRTILQARPNLNWETSIFFQNVVFHNGKFEMYYSTPFSTGKAISADGENWTFASTQPDFFHTSQPNSSFTGFGINHLLSENGILKCYYLAVIGGKQLTYYAERY